MEEFIVLGFLLLILTVLFFKPIKIWKTADFGLGIILLALVIVWFVNNYVKDYLGEASIYYYTIIGITLMVVCLRFKRNASITSDLTELDFIELEKALDHLKDESELLRQRFITTLELSVDGIVFRNNNDVNFGTDNAVKLLGIEDNEFTEEMFLKSVFTDDLAAYRNNFKKISAKNPKFNLTYRIKHEGTYIWIKEVGKLIVYNGEKTMISYLRSLDFKAFPVSTVDKLNGMLTQKDLFLQVKSMMAAKKPFYLMMVSLYNIPDINIKYGRDAGDLMMGDYIDRLNKQFSKDNSYLYRIGGIQFAIIIESNKKFDILNRALESGGDLLNLQMSFGGVKEVVYPKLGIASYPKDSNNASQLILYADKALKSAIQDHKKNYCYFSNIS